MSISEWIDLSSSWHARTSSANGDIMFILRQHGDGRELELESCAIKESDNVSEQCKS